MPLPLRSASTCVRAYFLRGVCAEVINRCTGVFWDNANLVKKIAFPKVLLHSYIAAAGAANLVIIIAVFLIFLAVVDALPPLVPLLVSNLVA